MKINMEYYAIARQALMDVTHLKDEYPEFFKKRDWFVTAPIILLEDIDFDIAREINNHYCMKGRSKYERVERYIASMKLKTLYIKDNRKDDFRQFLSKLRELICEHNRNRDETKAIRNDIWERFNFDRWDGYDRILDFSTLFNAHSLFAEAEKNFSHKERKRIILAVEGFGSSNEEILELVDNPSFHR